MLAEKKRAVRLTLMVMYPIYLYLLIIACPYAGNSLADFMSGIKEGTASGDAFFIPRLYPGTIKICFIGSLVYMMVSFIIIDSMKNLRTDEEYGSARWGSAYRLNRFFSCKENAGEEKAKNRNVRLTENVRMGFDVYRHNFNLNVLIFGGSGTRKTRGFILPNLMLGNCSFVVTDPKGEILGKVGKLLLKIFGYEIRVLDLKNHERSFCYNPFVYFRNENDILQFVNQMWEAMSDKTASKGEQIWDDQAKNMLLSFMLFLFRYAPSEEQNFSMVMELLHEVKADEGAGAQESVLDLLFNSIPPDDVAYGFYKAWNSAKGRTLASIAATLSARLAVFNLDSLKKLTYTDELKLLELATKKVALFCVIPDNDTSYNFLAGTLYSQLFQQLYDYADNVCHGPLPVHVRFLMDEFANVALPDNYEKILSTARSRNMSFVIVLQNKVQIQAIFEKIYQSLIGNCDSLLFLGSNELETCKYFSDLMDKETVVVRTYNKTLGPKGTVTRNETKIGRELMTAGELRKLPNRKAVLIIRGFDPVIDNKINLKKCRYYRVLADGIRSRKNHYDWGNTGYATGEARLMTERYSGHITPLPDTNGVLVSDKELLTMFR